MRRLLCLFLLLPTRFLVPLDRETETPVLLGNARARKAELPGLLDHVAVELDHAHAVGVPRGQGRHPDGPVRHDGIDVRSRRECLYRPQHLVPAPAEYPAGAASGCILFDTCYGSFDALRTVQVQADVQESLVIDVRVRVGEPRQHNLAAAVDAIIFCDAREQDIIPCGEDLAVGIEDENTEFTDTVRRRGIADDVVDGGVRRRGRGERPEAAEGGQQAAGIVHAFAPLALANVVAKIPRFDNKRSHLL